VQESIGTFDFGVHGTQSIAAVANLSATKPGTASTGTVLLIAHYDTVAGSPGAGDDGIGVGVLLETARALSTAGASRNDVMILLTDAEEHGLHGEAAFVRERAKELGTAVVLNHEAPGDSGLPERRMAARCAVYLLALAAAAIMLGPAVWGGLDVESALEHRLGRPAATP
jgi:Zn-dependent M28 family amino/carboxypeptidase